MGDKSLIFTGLLLFVALVTFPVWRDLAAGTTTRGPKLTIPSGQGQKTCVAPTDTMRDAHVDLLMSWRSGKVRHQKREFKAYNGKVYRVSLTNTCLGCHGNKKQFCESCHAYAGVPSLVCWKCHPSPSPESAPVALGRTGEGR
jgi:hypothetical protein